MRRFTKLSKPLALLLTAGMGISGMPVVANAEGNDDNISDAYKEEGYHLVWNDEFDGTALKTDDWNVEEHEPGWVNAELQRYTPLEGGNISVQDGYLKIQPAAQRIEGEESLAQAEVLKSNVFDSNWSGGSNEDGKGSVSIANGKATVSIENPGSVNYGIQLQQQGLKLESGHKYSLTFKAKSDVDRAVEISFLDPENAWDWYAGAKTVITPEEKDITLEFEVGTDKATSSTIALQLNFGKIDGHDDTSVAATVDMSDVSLVDLSVEPGELDVKKAYNYTSGRISTQNKHDFTYGRFEARARVPEGKGYLPAFWLMATDESEYGQWPQCGEVDIMEVMGQETNKSYHTIHYGYDSGSGHRENQGTLVLEDGDFSTDYHTYILDWEPGKLTWYVDDKEVYSTSDWYTGKDDDSQLTYPAPFDHNMYVILNLAVGGSWVTYPDQAVVDDMANQSYDIDYVRVYQKDAEVYKEQEANVEKPVHEIVYREADETGNYVVNGDFTKDLKADGSIEENWELHLEGDAKETTYKVKDNAVTINPSAAGGVDYSVQLKQTGFPMYKGWEYELTFDAYAAEDRSIIVDLEGPDNGWTRYFNDTKVDITTEKKTYTYTFTMDQKTDANGSLEFNLGNQGSTAPVTISNVKLTHKSGDVIEEKVEKSVRQDGNYVYNGSFDQGDKRLGFWEIDEEDKSAVSVTNDGLRRELEVKVEVPEGASEANPVVVSQSELAPFVSGDYAFSFDAYQADGETDGLTAVLAGKEYVPELGTSSANFSYKVTFDQSLSREDSKVEFKFTKPGTYYLDNVMVCEDAIIKNSSFEAGLSGYTTGVYGDASASFGVDSITDGNKTAFDADIKDTGSADWHIQLKQAGITLEEGKSYTLTFDGRATVDRAISVVMQRDGSKDDNWEVYSGSNDVELTKDWKTYTKTFTMEKATDANVLLSVSLGAIGEKISDAHHVYLDNFSLVEADGSEVDNKDDDKKDNKKDDSKDDNKDDKKDDSKKDDSKQNADNKADDKKQSTTASDKKTDSATNPVTSPDKTEDAGKTNGDGKVQKGETVITSVCTFKATSTKEAALTAPKSKNNTSVTVPATVKIDSKTVKVTYLAADSFKNNKKLKAVVIGKNVKKIGPGAFRGCKNLSNITVYAKNLKSVSKTAFKNVPNKKTVKVTIYAANKKQFNKTVKMFKKAGLTKATYKFKKQK